MGKWESKMTAGERRGLTNHLVAAAIEEVAKNDELHICCFLAHGV